MDETQHRQLSIAQELMLWADSIPCLLAKIDSVLKLPHIDEAQAVEVEWIAERIERLFLGIQKAVNESHYGRLIASTDRLCEEIAAGNATLDELLKSDAALGPMPRFYNCDPRQQSHYPVHYRSEKEQDHDPDRENESHAVNGIDVEMRANEKRNK